MLLREKLSQEKGTMEILENQEGYYTSDKIPVPKKELAEAAAKRMKCIALADSFKRLGYVGRAVRVRDCSTQMVFAYIPTEDRMTLHRVNSCRDRMCPMCSKRRSRQIFAQVSQVMDVIEKEQPQLVPVFLTLTVRNCKGEELSATLDTIFKGWNRFMSNDRMKRLVVGWFRAQEITYNVETDTYHPHVHTILLMPPSYFTIPKDYMTTEKWVAAWKKALRLDYDPVCDIRVVDVSKGSAVAEVAKYCIKDADYIKPDADLMDKLVQVFGTAIRGRRLYAFGGLMKEVFKRLQLEEDIQATQEVIDEAGNVLRKDIDYILLLYRWNVGLTRYEYGGRV